MECHDSSVFLIRKLPLSITEALLKSMKWSWDHAWFAIRNLNCKPCMVPCYGPSIFLIIFALTDLTGQNLI